MEELRKDLYKYRLEKSKKDLEGARVLFNNKLYTQSINRSYYSIFHCVRALLAFDKFDSKKHSGIIAYFNQNYVKTGLLDKKLSEILMSAEKIRMDSDYDDLFAATDEQAEKQISNAEFFIDTLSDFILSNKL
jgi:uncharacterized protein (UPF0332 family)